MLIIQHHKRFDFYSLFPLRLQFSLVPQSNHEFDIAAIVDLMGIRLNECLLFIKQIIIEGNVTCVESLSVYTFCKIYHQLSLNQQVILQSNHNIYAVKISYFTKICVMLCSSNSIILNKTQKKK